MSVLCQASRRAKQKKTGDRYNGRAVKASTGSSMVLACGRPGCSAECAQKNRQDCKEVSIPLMRLTRRRGDDK